MRRPLKVGLLTSIGSTLEAFFPEITRRWLDAGVEVVTAAADAAPSFHHHREIAGLSRRPGFRNARAVAGLRAWVREESVDVVLTNTATASTLARMAGLGVPVVYFCHGLHWDRPTARNLTFRLVERALLARTAGILCLNSADERWFLRHGKGIPLRRLRLGVGLDPHRYPRTPRLRSTPPVRLVWCGEFSDRKDPRAALAVARALLRRQVDFTLTMIGQGALLEVVKAEARDLSGRIDFPGQSDPVPHLQKGDALLHTAHWEGLPRVCLEALAVGRPTAGYDVKGVQDIPGAYLASPGDTEGLASAVLHAVRDGARQLPTPEELSYTAAADDILEFLRRFQA